MTKCLEPSSGLFPFLQRKVFYFQNHVYDVYLVLYRLNQAVRIFPFVPEALLNCCVI